MNDEATDTQEQNTAPGPSPFSNPDAGPAPQVKKAPEKLPTKPDEVKIVQIDSVLVPTASMAGVQNFSVMCYGLGDDSKLYSWNGNIHAWVLN